jgi:hypothetical protein
MAVNKVRLDQGFGPMDFARKRLVAQVLQQRKNASITVGRAGTGEVLEEVGDDAMDNLAKQANLPAVSLFI